MKLNKYALLGVLVLTMMIITYLSAGVIESAETDVMRPPTSGGTEAGAVLNMVRAFLRLLSFSVPGVPNFFIVLVVYPINFVIFYMILDILKDVVPFT